MSIQILPQSGGLGTQLGAGFGQGLAESLPKGIQQGRLSATLRNLEGQKLSPLEQIARLTRQGGVSAQEAGQLLPYIQQAQGRQALQQQAQGASTATPAAASQGAAAPIKTIAPAGEAKHPYASEEQIRESKSKYLQEPTVQQIAQLADQYIQQGRTQDPNQAMQQAQTDLRQNMQAQQNKRSAIRTNLQERVGPIFDRSSLGEFSEIKNDLIDKAEYEALEKGESPEEVARTIGKEVRTLDKAATQTAALGSFSKIFTSRKEKESLLKAQAKHFDRLGYGEIFDDLATSRLGISPNLTASILHPLKNRAIEKEISSVGGKNRFQFKDLPSGKIEKIAAAIKPEDNLLSLMNELQDRKIDISPFRDGLLDLMDAGQLSLTEQQIRQLDKAILTKPSLGDILFKMR